MLYYKKEEISETNILFQVIGCVSYGVMQRFKGKSNIPSSSVNNAWISGSIGRYPESFVCDVAAYLKVINRRILSRSTNSTAIEISIAINRSHLRSELKRNRKW